MKTTCSNDPNKTYYVEVNLTEVLRVNKSDGFDTAYGCIMHTYAT